MAIKVEKAFWEVWKMGNPNTFNEDVYVNESIYLEFVAARLLFLNNFPFWGYTSLDINLIEVDPMICPTAMTDGYNIYYNAEFVNKLNNGNVRFLFAHELYHNIYNHVGGINSYSGNETKGRFKDKSLDSFIVNAATDTFINLELMKYKVGDAIVLDSSVKNGGIFCDKKYANLSSDEIYIKMINNSDYKGKSFDEHIDIEIVEDEGEGEGNGEGEGEGEGNGEGDLSNKDKIKKIKGKKNVEIETDENGNITKIKIKMSKKQIDKLDESWKDRTIKAAIQDKQSNNSDSTPSGIRIQLDTLNKPKLHLKNVLRRFVSNVRSVGYSFSRPDKKVQGIDYILPGYRRSTQQLEVVIAIDSSGSMGVETLTKIFGEINGVFKAYPKYIIHMFTFDTTVLKKSYRKFSGDTTSSELDIKDYIKHNIHGGGGTLFNSVWEYLKEENIHPKGLIFFTDGYPCDDAWAKNYKYCPTLFITVGNNNNWKAPFGQTMAYEDHP